MEKTIQIKGISCGHCVKAAERALGAIEGVTAVKVSLEEKSAVIEAAVSVTDSVIMEAISEAGFKVISIK